VGTFIPKNDVSHLIPQNNGIEGGLHDGLKPFFTGNQFLSQFPGWVSGSRGP
jgi:hypothetical protein